MKCGSREAKGHKSTGGGRMWYGKQETDSLSEMKSQMRATAPLRTSHGSPSVHNINNQDTLLPVITADISGQTGLYRRGNVLLDSGA